MVREHFASLFMNLGFRDCSHNPFMHARPVQFRTLKQSDADLWKLSCGSFPGSCRPWQVRCPSVLFEGCRMSNERKPPATRPQAIGLGSRWTPVLPPVHRATQDRTGWLTASMFLQNTSGSTLGSGGPIQHRTPV